MMSLQQATKYATERYMDSTIGSARERVAARMVHLLEDGYGPGVLLANLKRWQGMAIGGGASQLREEIDTVLKDIQEG